MVWPQSSTREIQCHEYLNWYFSKYDRILENSSKSHMKSSVFLHVFNDISTYMYVFNLWSIFYILSVI